MSVRVRYAPSPTGLQHIGGVRTALFNYFFARSSGGRFVLRIEDTDRDRYDEAALNDIYETFEWLGIHWDEGPDVGGAYGPYVQSERVELYRRHAMELLENGLAYKAYETPEELEAMREKGGYDRSSRDLTPEQRAAYEAEGRVPVIRFKVPLEGETVFDDAVLGRVKRKNKDIPADPVLLKSDGLPTYHLANVIDDHYMQITHILRAQEWVPSGALHVLLYDAFGWEPPGYCHLPMVMGKDGQKLSKRHGATSAIEFRRQGYLPEAIINYVTLLGWAYDDQTEFFTVSDLEELFSIERINKSPAVFDYKKLEWFNGVYIRQKTDDDLEELVLPYLKEAGLISSLPTEEQLSILRGALPLIRERLKVLSDAPGLVRFLFEEIGDYEITEAIPKKHTAEQALALLEESERLLEGFDERDDEENEDLFRRRAEELEVKIGNLLMPLRVAVTGSRVSPPLFGSIRLLGADRAKERVSYAKGRLREQVHAASSDSAAGDRAGQT
ncbi:MAG: glutamate--tRNA ligase [Spirochaetaceae bacterium]